ncbi:MAG: DUF5642 family protein [Mycobacterium sp.]|nr:DUF5642 family protein [Mycobacterium sp.]MBV9721639.1 DUF5642 family protein [Mycobacterium sp.]
MRLFGLLASLSLSLSIAASVALLLAACAHPREPAARPSHTAAVRHINPANIRRAGRELPPGYEVSALTGVAAPPASWGLGGDGAANPARCAALADPAGGHGELAQGISGSGTGGIVYAVIATVPTGPLALDQSLVAGCRQWSMTSRRARAQVHLVDPPRIDGAQTLGMVTDIVTSVEGGNEIDSRASTFTAYLGNYYAFTTVVSDPGSPDPALTPQFAAELLVKSVSAVRG